MNHRSSAALGLAALMGLMLTGCGPDDAPSTESPGVQESPVTDTEASPATDPAEPADDRPELWSAIDPALGTGGDQECSPYTLERDYLDGTLTPEDFTRYAALGPWDPPSIPEKYRPCPELEMLTTGGMLWALQFFDELDPAVQEEIQLAMSPQAIEVPAEG